VRSSEAAKRLGLSQRRLNELVQTGEVTPSVRSRKQGSRALWTDDDLERARAAIHRRRADGDRAFLASQLARAREQIRKLDELLVALEAEIR
jgi:hypothetical protein